jgi:hypothetical protein
MLKSRGTLLGVGLTALFGLLCIRNFRLQRNQTKLHNVSKSLIELGLIVLSARFLPGFLIAMCAAWIVKPINNTWAKITIGVLSSILLGVASLFALEGIVFLSAFAIDAKTGASETGAIGRHSKIRADELHKVRIAA